MNKLTQLFFLVKLCLLSTFLTSCGGDSGGSNANIGILDTDTGIVLDNTSTLDLDQFDLDGGTDTTNDTAPYTLDGLRLNVTDDTLIFNFTSTGGDASAGGEQGIIPAFVIPVGNSIPNFDLIASNGSITSYDYPEVFTNMQYTYVKQGANTGFLTITGNSFLHPSSTRAFYSEDSTGAFTANYLITFGSNTGNIDEISIETSVTATNGSSDIIVNYFGNTPNQGVYIQTQTGNPVPIGYDSDDAGTSIKSAAPSIYSEDLSDVVPLEITFVNPSDGIISYSIYGISSDDQGFTNVTDQGITSVDVTLVTSTVPFTATNVPYAWDTTSSNSTASLVLIIPVFDSAGNITSSVTESFNLDFNSQTSGSITQTQGNTLRSGAFDFPFAD